MAVQAPLADFTYSAYSSLLRQLLQKGYSFNSFPEAEQLLQRGQRFVLMRHDIDFDLHKALEMARLEAKEGIRATYFFMLRTEHYTLLSKNGSECVREILGLGHHLGLHFDCASYPANTLKEELAVACRREAGILRDWFGQAVQVVSYHRPAQNVLMGDPELSTPYINTYLPIFTKQIYYCSDSRGEWRFGNPIQTPAFENGVPLHILIHPIWWCTEPTQPLPVLNNLLEAKNQVFKGSFRENCTVFSM